MSLFGEYTNLKTISENTGEADIYKVRHNDLGYVRALRVLKKGVKSENDEVFLKFKEECKKLLRLGNGNHPNIVHIYKPCFWKEPDSDEDEGKAFVEMDFIDGEDILKYLEKNNHFIPIDDVLRMVEQISSALAYCHVDVYKYSMTKEEEKCANRGERIEEMIKSYRIVHNDVHSNNIMRRENGDYVLLDFGLAFDGKEFVRSTKKRAGVLEFMAPEKWDEKIEEKDLTPQLDVYGFGVVMYEYLAGRLPFDFKGKTEKEKLELMKRIKSGVDIKKIIPPIFDSRKEFYEKNNPGMHYEKDYPDWLEDVIIKCLQKDPAKRFKDGKELHDCIVDHLKESKEGGVVIGPDNATGVDNGTGKGKYIFIALLLLAIAGVCAYFGFYGQKKQNSAVVTINVKSLNDKMGVVTGGGTYPQNDTITIEAVPQKGYKFVRWIDGNTDGVRMVVADHDKEYIAQFETCGASVTLSDESGISDNSKSENVLDKVPVTEAPAAESSKTSVNDVPKVADKSSGQDVNNNSNGQGTSAKSNTTRIIWGTLDGSLDRDNKAKIKVTKEYTIQLKDLEHGKITLYPGDKLERCVIRNGILESFSVIRANGDSEVILDVHEKLN